MAKTTEADIALGVLQALQMCPDHRGSFAHIKAEVPKRVSLSAEDRAASAANPAAEAWEDLLHAVTSSRDSAENVVRHGYAEETGDGLRLTKAGVARLHAKGLT